MSRENLEERRNDGGVKGRQGKGGDQSQERERGEGSTETEESTEIA